MRAFNLSDCPIIDLPLGEAKPYARNPRLHPPRQIEMIMASFTKFGVINPILITPAKEVIAGHARLDAARKLLLSTIPAITLPHLSDEEVRALRIADNQISAKGEWSIELLADEIELIARMDIEFDPIILGFETGEIDFTIETTHKARQGKSESEPVLEPDRGVPPVSRVGDVFDVGPHRIVCGDARNPLVFQRAMGNRKASAVISDQPWNLPANFISGMGDIKHDDFVCAHGEMSDDEFEKFTATVLANQAGVAAPGAIVLQFIDWRSVDVMIRAGKANVGSLVNLCIWVKPSGGMGSRWRSRHELICAFQVPGGKAKNNVQLGMYGRNRTNVWEYASPSGFGKERERLKLHPTCKNDQMIADAIMDITDRNDVVLDAFLGSGTTLLAAHQTGRIGVGIELDPHYCDLAVSRLAAATGEPAVHADGHTFEELKVIRAAEKEG